MREDGRWRTQDAMSSVCEIVQVILITVGGALVCGCDPPVQSGKYVVGGTFSVATNLGEFVELRGCEAAVIAPDRPLLRLFTIFPGRVPQADLSYMHKSGESIICFDSKQGGRILDMKWDRLNDMVSIADRVFNRAKGNTFVAVQRGDSWQVFQGDTPVLLESSHAVENAIRVNFGDDVPLVKQLALVEVAFPKP